MVADIGDFAAIGRPGGVIFLVDLVGRELIELFGGDVVEIQQLGTSIRGEIPFDILLEVIAVDDDRLGLVFIVLLFFLRLGFDVFSNSQEQFLAVR